jgi:ATP-dependent Clp protease ATP-binding subunit ClpA
MGHRSVGPEHLLLGLLRDDAGPAAEALESLGVSFGAARREVRRLYGQAGTADEGASPAAEAPISNRAQAALERALRESGRQEGRRVGVDHVLAALVRDPRGGAVQVLAALGVTPDQVERELRWPLERVGKAKESRLKRSEKTMPDELPREEPTDEELDAQIRAAVPNREAMSTLPIADSDDLPPEPVPKWGGKT